MLLLLLVVVVVVVVCLSHLHAVKEGARDGVEGVGRADEKGLAHVHGGVNVVVRKGVVLRRVKQLKELAQGAP